MSILKHWLIGIAMKSDDGAVIAQFEIRRRGYLGADGQETAPLPDFAAAPSALLPLYRAMRLTRVFDAKAVALQRTGRLGTYAVSLGQEAVGVGIASAMSADDVLFPTYRDTAALLWRGVTMEELLLYWGGDERGSNFAACQARFSHLHPCRHASRPRGGCRLCFQAAP